MLYFIKGRSFLKRSSELIIVLALLGVGLYAYNHFRFRVEYLKPYHLIAYYDAIRLLISRDEPNSSTADDVSATAIPVLVYHGVLDDKEFEKGDQSVKYVSTSYSRFKDQLLELKKAGWNTITYKQFNDFLQQGVGVPEKSFLLTFDDARKDSFYPVDPLLKALNYSAVSFVITARSLETTKSTYYLVTDELKMASDTGRWEILSHGKNDHDYIVIDEKGTKGTFMGNKKWLSDLNRLENEDEFKNRIRSDLETSKHELEAKFGQGINGFAFPFGDFGASSLNFPGAEAIVRTISSEIYNVTFHQASYLDTEVFNYPSNAGMARRIKGDSSLDGKSLVSLFQALSPKNLPYKTEFKKAEELKKNWGELALDADGAVLRPGENSTSAFYTVSGSAAWSDYAAKLAVRNSDGQAVSLIGYYKDEQDFFSCTYTKTYLKLQRKLNGTLELLGEVKINLPEERYQVSLGVDHEGKFSCGLDGKTFASLYVVSSNDRIGQFGLRVWDPIPNKAKVEISNLEASTSRLDATDVSLLAEQDADGTVQQIQGNADGVDEETVVEDLDLPLKLTFTGEPDGLKNWKSTWGNMDSLDTGLKIRATRSTTGAMALLQGTKKWDDFKITYDLRWADGTNLVAVLRYQDPENFLAMNIHDDYIRLEEYYKGRRRVIEEVTKSPDSKGNYREDLNLTLRTYKNKVTVFINGIKKLESHNPDRLPPSGLVGLKVWDKNRNEASVLVHSVMAESL